MKCIVKKHSVKRFKEEFNLTFPESVCSLWYYPSINRFTDEDGNILHDLSDRFDVWQLDEWKKDKEYGI